MGGITENKGWITKKNIIESICSYWLNDEKVMLAAIKGGGSMVAMSFEYASENLKNNKDFMRQAVKLNGHALHYADKSAQNIEDIQILAANQLELGSNFTDADKRKDINTVLKSVSKRGGNLLFVNEEFKRNKDVVLAAVQQDGYALEYASEKLKKDKDVVLAAVQQNGLALDYASDRLKAVKEIVLAAVKNNIKALKYADKMLLKDKSFMNEVFEYYKFFRHASNCYERNQTDKSQRN
jgi:hypothetical protein